MDSAFRRGAREGMRAFLPISVGLVPWAIVTGIAMRSIGLSELEAMGMSLLVFAATAQLGTLPLIASGAPLWLIFLTGLVLNLRFVIFSAAIAPAFHEHSMARRLASSYLLVDGVFVAVSEKLRTADDPQWRWGCYLAPAVYGWMLWQACSLVGVLGAGAVPHDWSLEFMATIALMVMLVPMVRTRPMLLAAVVGGVGTVLLRGLPLRLGLFVAIALGIAAGFAAEHWQERRAAR
ncbi:MAG: AzlC family ABC transporter permease [Proteobacteria bacterium]|nr:AzlC family ABC transporter permease [Pseudomonadota bacterium]